MFGLFRRRLRPFPPLSLYNSESRTQEVFTPLRPNHVTMYSCGPTVYDYATIGNLRSYIFADTLKRTLILNGYEVNHTINLTDFGHLTSDADTGDDKMMKGLRREGMEISLENMRRLSDRYIQAFQEDCHKLRILPPTQWARASEYITQQIRLIETLEEKGYTYRTKDGVYFDISTFPTYGRLGKINLEALKSGARIEENPEKRHPADFAVWKNGELGWESRWGKGFPGWHIECSAMAFATLGKQIDIHTGGIDHIPVHHNCEIAQCESVSKKQFVRYWLHNEFLQINHKRIGKSEGNATYLQDLQETGITADEYRYWLLTAHYRSPINLSTEALTAAQTALLRLKRMMYTDWANERGKVHPEYFQRFVTAINDDLDTPKAISVLWELTKDNKINPGDKRVTIEEFDRVLAVGLSEPSTQKQATPDSLPEEVSALVAAREAAREAKDWTEADRLRDKITAAGYTIEDSQQGPQLTKAVK